MSDSASPIEEHTGLFRRIIKSRATSLGAGLLGGAVATYAGTIPIINRQAQDLEEAQNSPGTVALRPMSVNRKIMMNEGDNHYELLISAKTFDDGNISYATDVENVDVNGKLLGRPNANGAALYPTSISISGKDNANKDVYIGQLLEQRGPGEDFPSTRTSGGVGASEMSKIAPGNYKVTVQVGNLDDLGAKPASYDLPITVEPAVVPRFSASGLSPSL